MPYRRNAFLLGLLLVAGPAVAQGSREADDLKRYTECMRHARQDPLKAIPAAERWFAEGGGYGARHCVAMAMFQAGRFAQAAAQFEAIARDMGRERPGLRAELWTQAGQAWLEAGDADRAVAAHGRAIELKPSDAEPLIDRSLAHAARQAWAAAITDLDRALALRPNDVEVLVLRAAAWRQSGNSARAVQDAERALGFAPDHSEALLERGFARLARGDRSAANADFLRVARLVPPGSAAARRAEAGLRGELPGAAAPAAPPAPQPAPAPRR